MGKVSLRYWSILVSGREESDVLSPFLLPPYFNIPGLLRKKGRHPKLLKWFEYEALGHI